MQNLGQDKSRPPASKLDYQLLIRNEPALILKSLFWGGIKNRLERVVEILHLAQDFVHHFFLSYTPNSLQTQTDFQLLFHAAVSWILMSHSFVILITCQLRERVNISFENLDVDHWPTAMFRPSRAHLAASCRASFLVPQYFMVVNICPFTKTCAPNPPCTPGASPYLGVLILFFWQYWFKMLTKSTKLPGERMKTKLQLSKILIEPNFYPTLSRNYKESRCNILEPWYNQGPRNWQKVFAT